MCSYNNHKSNLKSNAETLPVQCSIQDGILMFEHINHSIELGDLHRVMVADVGVDGIIHTQEKILLSAQD